METPTTKEESSIDTRCALYMRVSTESQASEGYSLEAQQAALRAYAKMRDWVIFNEYIDGGFSGSTDQRPEFQRLMHDARGRYFKTVIVVKLDRFMRNQRHLLNTLYELQELGVSFVSTGESLDTSTPQGELVLQLMGSIAEHERKRIGERIRDIRQHLAAQGQWSSGRTPFAYRFNKESKELEIYEPEARVIRFAFATYTSQPMGIIKLAEAMNIKSLITPRLGVRNHTTWTQSAVRHILSHPAYKGGPNDQWPYKTPLIVSPEVWEVAQRQLASNRHFKPNSNTSLQYRGKLRCGLCGHTLAVGYNHNTRAMYECAGRLKRNHLDGSSRCTLPRMDANRLESGLKQQIEQLCSDPAMLTKHLEDTLNNLEVERAELEARLKPLEAEANRVREDMAVFDAMLKVHRIDPDEYDARIKELQSKLRGLEKRQGEADPLLLRDLGYNKATVELYRMMLPMVSSPSTTGGKVRLSHYKEFITWLLSGTPPNYLIPNIGQDLLDIPQNIFKSAMVGMIYPDRIELKGSLQLGKADVSLGSKSDNLLPLPISIKLALPALVR